MAFSIKSAKGTLTCATALLVVALAIGFLAGCADGGELGDAHRSEAPESQPRPADAESTTESEDIPGVPAEATVTVEELHDLLEANGPLVVDIRPLYAFDQAAIIGSVSIPAGSQFEVRYEEIPRDSSVCLIDRDGSRVAEAWDYLVSEGYDPAKVLVVEGGMDAWQAAGYGTRETEIRRC